MWEVNTWSYVIFDLELQRQKKHVAKATMSNMRFMIVIYMHIKWESQYYEFN